MTQKDLKELKDEELNETLEELRINGGSNDLPLMEEKDD